MLERAPRDKPALIVISTPVPGVATMIKDVRRNAHPMPPDATNRQGLVRWHGAA
jgi:hypothetical protein